MIDVYTINKKYGDPIVKRKALKLTDKTVTFENGSRENLSNDYRSHFDTLEKAIEYFEFYHKMRLKFIDGQLERQHQNKAFFDEFVAKERGEA